MNRADGRSRHRLGAIAPRYPPDDRFVARAGIAGGTLLHFRVDDIQETYVRLRSRDVQFHGTPHLVARMPVHDLWIAFLKDPDGNMLGLMSEIPRG